MKIYHILLFVAINNFCYAQINIDSLIKNLESPNIRTKIYAALSLKSMGEKAYPAIPALTNLLSHRHSKIRLATAGALAKIGPKSIPELIVVLETKNDLAIVAAAKILGTFGEKSLAAVPILLDLLNRSNLKVRISALGALGNIGVTDDQLDKLAKSLISSEPLIRISAIKAIAKTGNKCITKLAPILQDNNIQVRKEAIIALTNIGRTDSSIVSILIPLLQDGEIYPQIQQALISIGKPSIPPLVKLLQHQKSKMRYKAAIVIEEIIDQIKDSELKPFFTQTQLPILIRALQDRQEVVRWVALRGIQISGIKSQVVIDALIKALNDPYDKICILAIKMLATMELGIDHPAIGALIDKLSAQHPAIQPRLIKAFAKIGPNALCQLIQKRGINPHLIVKAILAVPKVFPENVEVIKELLYLSLSRTGFEQDEPIRILSSIPYKFPNVEGHNLWDTWPKNAQLTLQYARKYLKDSNPETRSKEKFALVNEIESVCWFRQGQNIKLLKEKCEKLLETPQNHSAALSLAILVRLEHNPVRTSVYYHFLKKHINTFIESPAITNSLTLQRTILLLPILRTYRSSYYKVVEKDFKLCVLARRQWLRYKDYRFTNSRFTNSRFTNSRFRKSLNNQQKWREWQRFSNRFRKYFDNEQNWKNAETIKVGNTIFKIKFLK